MLPSVGAGRGIRDPQSAFRVLTERIQESRERSVARR